MNEITLCLPVASPELDALSPLVAAMAEQHGVEPAYTGQLRARGERFDAADEVADYLLDQGLVLDEGRDGALYVACPWASGHSSDSGITQAAYFPAGTGGFHRGHYRCLHASCAARTDNDFFEAVGCGTSEDFEALPPIDDAQRPTAQAITATPYAWRPPEKIPLRPWLFGRWLLRGNPTALVAPGGIGKTTTLDTIALSLATARPLLGKEVWGGPKRVWLWNLEDDMDERSRSIQAAAKHHEVTEQEIAGRLFVDSAMDGAGLCTAVEDAAGFRLIAPVFEQITAQLIARGIDTLIIDPFVSSHQVDENANSKIDKIAKAWGRVAKEANASIVLVHHTSKQGAGEVTALSARGAVALVNACRSALVLNRMSDEEAERLGISGDAERRRYFTIQDDKHNRAPAEKAEWFHLASVLLGNGDLDGGDSMGVVERWIVPEPDDGLPEDHLLQVQLALSKGEHREDYQSPAWAGIAVAHVLRLDAEAKGDRARIRKLLKGWILSGALTIVERDDAARRSRKWIEVGEWHNDAPAPPENGGAEQGGAGEAKACSTTTPPFNGVGVVERLPAVERTVVVQRSADQDGRS